MFGTLSDWEQYFADKIRHDKCTDASHAPLLPIVPDRIGWDAFLVCVRDDWKKWKSQLSAHPACLLMLYCGLAFYEYDENTFWPQFAKIVASGSLPPNQQTDINEAFGVAANHFHLGIKRRDKGSDFVGTAVNFIGIPLSLWDGFLEICDWAAWQGSWKSLSDEEWGENVEKRAGSRTRLRRFLTENREPASRFIQEVLDAREILLSESQLTIKDIAQASILRAEYFDDVPETADFLRPQDPDSLFRYRVRLVWDERRQNLSLLLPAVSRDKLPAVWRVGSHQQDAAPSPDEFVLNSEAFSSSLVVSLEMGDEQELQRVRGINEWGLFDLENGGRLTNIGRDQLPLRSYLPMFLLSQSPDGMKWEDLALAKDVIAPSLRFSPYILRKYERLGLAVQRGRRWMIRENRAESIPMSGDKFQLNYCGDPSVLWALYRRMICDIPGDRFAMGSDRFDTGPAALPLGVRYVQRFVTSGSLQ